MTVEDTSTTPALRVADGTQCTSIRAGLSVNNAGEVRARLFCFPYAGGSSLVFREWESGVGPDIEVFAVDYPGHLFRSKERLIKSMGTLARVLGEELSTNWDLPFALCGASLGALVALELARIAEAVDRRPELLVVAACPPPNLLLRRPRIAGLRDDAFLRVLAERYGGLGYDAEVDPRVRRVVLPIIRADVELLEEYVRSSPAAVSCDVLAVAGADDLAAAPADLAGWNEFSTGHFRLLTLRGGHFFIEAGSSVLDELWSLLRQRLRSA